jgi:hypothetical protein
MDDVRASLANLADPRRRVSGPRPATAKSESKPEVRLERAFCTWEKGGLELTLFPTGGWVEAVPQALDLPERWDTFGRLQVRVEAVDGPVRVEVSVAGARSRLVETRDLECGEEAVLDVPLDDLPLAAGTQPPHAVSAVRLTGTWVGGPATRLVRLKGLALIARTDGPPGPRVDRFGQRASGAWPGKVQGEEDLRAAREAEALELEAMVLPPDRDEYGGWMAGPALEASGFFRADRDAEGRWWLVDPRGRPFWSLGTTGVRTTSEATPPAGREFLYEALPGPDGPFAAAWSDRGFSFYCWNVLRKYGSKEDWRDAVVRRFRRWGMNTIANTSEDIVLDQRAVPHVRRADTRGPGLAMATQRFPDVFDPAWEAHLDEIFARRLAPNRDNPWLLGYFVDNEWPWRDMRLLETGPKTALRREWQSFVRRSEGAEGDLGDLSAEAVPAEGPLRDLVRAFEAHYAERYFTTVARLVHKHDPNHLYLGCRFVQEPPHESIIRAARHADVVSVNCYSLYPDRGRFEDWHRACGRPILIGEHHLPLASERQLAPHYSAFSEAERRRYYVKFLRQTARMPFAVGSHWFQFADQPPTGRTSDGENQTIGLVDITDRPHLDLIGAVREVAARMYAWHAAAV